MAKRHSKHRPSAKAKAAYNRNIVKAYHRLHNVVAKHKPSELRINHG